MHYIMEREKCRRASTTHFNHDISHSNYERIFLRTTPTRFARFRDMYILIKRDTRISFLIHQCMKKTTWKAVYCPTCIPVKIDDNIFIEIIKTISTLTQLNKNYKLRNITLTEWKVYIIIIFNPIVINFLNTYAICYKLSILYRNILIVLHNMTMQ